MKQLAILLLSLHLCSFVLSQVCPRQCSCRARYADCANRNLYSIPNFPSGLVQGNYDTLDLRNNHIAILNNNSFQNAPFKTVILKNNSLNNNISAGAFHGLENSVEKLDLSYNRLSVLPESLSQLSKIEELDITHNPIRHSYDFTDSVMKQMGDTMYTFHFGSENLREWPKTLNHFVQLQELHVDTLHRVIRRIPPQGFHGFETTILRLRIENTWLDEVPLGISNLRNLKELYFDDNHLVKNQGLLLQSFPTRSKDLQTLSLSGDGITQFPTVVKYLRGLKDLSLDRNSLDFLSDVSIGGNVTVSNLTLIDCALDRIPGALSDLKYLTRLDLSRNNIRTIEQNDLRDLPQLQHLKIGDSSLEYISNNAFENLHNLASIDFRNTSLTKVPEAINDTYPCVNQIHLEGNKIDCMCETLVWLSSKKSRCTTSGYPMNIHGECDTIHSSVENYVQGYIPKCPQYKEEHGLAPYN